MAGWRTSNWRKALRWVAGGFASLLVIAIAAWQAGALNGVALWGAGRAIGYDISCGVLSGDVLGRFTCTDLALADAKGRFLQARRFSLDWNALALLGNEAALTRISVADATITRLPKDTSSTSNEFLPGTRIVIGTLDVRHLVLAMNEMPDACIDLGGKGTIGPEGFDAALTLARCAPGAGQLVFSGRYDKPSGALNLDAHGQDDGAIATALTGVERAGATVLNLYGTGTVAAFNGTFTARAEGLGRIEAAFHARDLSATRLDAIFALAPPVQPAWAPKGQGTLSGDIASAPDGGLDIRSASLDWGGLHGSLQLSRAASGALRGRATLNTQEPCSVGGTRIDGLNARVQIGGTQSQPILTGAATVSGIAVSGSAVSRLQANFRVGIDRGRLASTNIVGHADGVDLPAPLAGFFGTALGFHGTVSRDAAGALALDGAVNGAAASLGAEAEAGETTGHGSVTLTVPDLASADAGFSGSAIAGLTLERLTLHGDMEGAIRVEGAKISPDGAGAALGASPVLTAQIRAANGGYMLSDIRLDTAAGAARGSASATPAGALEARLETTRGDLAPFSGLAGLPLTGGFTLRANVSGTRTSPSLTLSANAPRMMVRDNEVTNASLRLGARKQAKWDAELALDAATAAGAVAVAMNAQTAETGWTLTITKGALGPATLAGRLSKSGDRLSGNMTLSGDLLAPVGVFAGEPMHGSGTLSLSGDGEGLRLAADLKDVIAGPLKKATAHAEATSPALGKPITVSLSLKDGADRLAAAATVVLNPVSVTLGKFGGEWAGTKFALVQPARFATRDGAFTLEKTTIGISGGTFTVSATGQGDALSAEAHLSGMPVAPIAALLQLGKAKGTLGLDFTASMAPGKTEAQFSLNANDLVFTGAVKKAESTDVSLTAQWDGNVLTTDGRITELDAAPATLSARVPLVRSRGSYLPRLAQSGPVVARLRAQMRAERLLALLPVAEQTLSGDLTVSADVAGDIARPQFSGRIAIAKGSFDNYETGTRLENLNASIDASGGSNAVLALEATDGNSGTVKARGEFSMAALETGGIGRLAGHVDMTLNKAEILRGDLIEATATGSLAIDLPGDQPPNISGKLRTDTVRIDLGAAIPPDVPEIEVTEINGGVFTAAPMKKPSRFSEATLNIAFAMPNRIFVTGHGIDSEWNGDLNVAGTIGKPDVSGKLALVRGQAELIGKNFTLKEGSVVPDSSAKGDATVHLVAENESSDITVTVTADGPVADPKLTWTSSPALPKDEILSRLFFGKSTPHISALQALQLAQLSGQLGSLGGHGGGGILSFARRLTGLDVLRVETPSDTSKVRASVSAGKYISDKVYVGVKQGADVSAGTAQVQVKITPNITLDAEAGANSQGSVGATWKWDY